MRVFSRLTASVVAAAGLGFSSVPASAFAQTTRYNITADNVTAPANAVEGEPISITATFSSNSTANPASFRWSAYLTQNGVIAGATFLGRFGPLSLNAVDTRAVTEQVTLPADVVGRYTIAVVADVTDAVAEFDELDNAIAAANVTRIREELPDAAIVSVATRELETREGNTVRVLFTIENSGELDATFTVGAYLSSDPNLSTTDTMLGTLDVTVAAGAHLDRTLDVVIPPVALAGDYTIGVIADAAGALAEVDELNNVRAAPRTLNIFRDTLEIVTQTLPEATRSIGYHVLIQASGGDGHYHFNVSDGTLPAGLSLDPASGVFAGVPSESGEQRFTVTVTSHNLSASKTWTVLVDGTGDVLTIVTLSIVPGAIGLPYAQTLLAAGGEPPYEWTLGSGMVPNGLDLRTDGVISGVPTVLGDFTFEAAVTDRLGARDSAVFEVSVSPPVTLLILDTDLPALPVGAEVTHALNVTGGVPPYHWVALSTPPPGLRVTENGRLTGTPTEVGRFPVLVRAEDSTQAGASDSRLIQVTVADDGALSIDTSTLETAHLRVAYEAELTAKGGTPPLTWSIVGGDDPPPGFYLMPGDGTKHPRDSAILRGTAIRSFVHAFTVEAEDAYGRKATKLLVLEVPGVELNSSAGCNCVASRERGDAGSLAAFFGLLLLAGILPRAKRALK